MIFQTKLIASLKSGGDKVAIEYNGENISYNDVYRTSKKITKYLLDLGVSPQTNIGLVLPDRLNMICSMIGVINARLVFVPLDHTLSSVRKNHTKDSLNLEYVITSREIDEQFPEVKHKLYIEEILEQINGDSLNIDYPNYNKEDSLYIYFTSGSSGGPKGILGKNKSLSQYLNWQIETFNVTSTSKFSQLISPYFDAFLRDIFVPLLTHGTICIPPITDAFWQSEKLIDWIEKSNVTMIHCVPSVFRLINNQEYINNQRFNNLEYVFLSGEKINPKELTNWYDTFQDRIKLMNFYGTTETTMIRSFYEINSNDIFKSNIPIGKPIADTEFHILDKKGNQVSTLLPGELYIASHYITKGYINAPELNKERFIELINNEGEKISAFKTGDFVRKLPSGDIELIGREDRQIKLRGIRIDLGEIETTLESDSNIKRAIALLIKGDDVHGNDSIVAYIVKRDTEILNDKVLSTSTEKLKETLPSYMIPSRTIIIDEVPLLSNGKIDYQRLKKDSEGKAITLPINENEEKLLLIWKEILGDKEISTQEAFQTYGGNSLSLMRLVSKIYTVFQVRFPLDQLFKALTIEKQAAYISKSETNNLYKIKPADKKESYALSASQERMYFEYELDKNSVAYNLPVAWKMTKEVSPELIKNIFSKLIERHEILRTQFVLEDGFCRQLIKPNLDFDVKETFCKDEELYENIKHFIQPFDLMNAPLFRIGIFKLERTNVLVFDMHHIISDGISQAYLFDDFISYFNDVNLEPLKIQYKDYAEWEKSFESTNAFSLQREFWLKIFETDIPKLQWPILEKNITHNSSSGGEYYFEIEKEQLNTFFDEQISIGNTTFSIFYAAFQLLLLRFTGQEDVVIGINTSGRTQEALEGVLGMFTKTLPIRCKIENPEITFNELVKKVNAFIASARNNQIFDLSKIISELNKIKKTQVKDLFEVMLVFQDFYEENKEASLDISPLELPNTTSKFPLTLSVVNTKKSFQLYLEYSKQLFSEVDIELFAEEYKDLIFKSLKNGDLKISELLPDSTVSKVIQDDLTFNF